MRVEDLTIEVRDRTLKRVGQVTPLFLDLKGRTRWCAVGEWTLTLPGTHAMVPYLATPGSGLIVRGPSGTPDGVLFSGPTRTPGKVRNQKNPDGTYTFSGLTDEVILAGARAFPDPSIADPQASSQSRSNDTRSGDTETLLREFVSRNIGPLAPVGRKRGRRQYLTLSGADLGRGIPQTKSPRFQSLLELLQEIVTFDPDLGFRVVQVGGSLEFQVLDARDRSAFVRFDVENGTIVSEEVQISGPIVTDAIVAGQGEGTDRTIVRRTTPESLAAEAEWGDVWETFIDQRDTDDLAELNQSGDEALIDGQGGTAVKMVPVDSVAMRAGEEWRLGDVVGAVVSGTQTAVRVTEVALIAGASGVSQGVALGDVSGFTQADAQAATVQSLDSRLSNLERASAGPISPDRLPEIPWDSLEGTALPTHARGLINASEVPNSFGYGISVGEVGTGFPFSLGVVETTYLNENRARQIAYQKDGTGQVVIRHASSNVWSAWQTLTPVAASDTVAGVVERATQAEVTAGSDATRFVTPDTLAGVVGVGSGYRLQETQLINSSGTWNKPAGCRAIRVRVQGGGGAGGGAPAAGSGAHTSGGGGGGGGYAERFIVGPNASYSVTIGAGGTPGSAGSAGGDGGETTFGGVCTASGGKGGDIAGSSALMVSSNGGEPGEGTIAGADGLKAAGQPGGIGTGNATLGIGGQGGGSMLGGGGPSKYTGAGSAGITGAAGTGYGSGGAGGSANAGASARQGGAGRPGIVFVDIYV